MLITTFGVLKCIFCVIIDFVSIKVFLTINNNTTRTPVTRTYARQGKELSSIISCFKFFFIVSAINLSFATKEQPRETLEEFFDSLHFLSKDCDLQAVTAEEYRNELVRNAFYFLFIFILSLYLSS